MRTHPDTYPTRLLSFLTRDPSGVPQWADWTDAHIPRTNRNYRFVRAFGVSRIERQWWCY